MIFEPNPLYYWMAEKYAKNKVSDDKIIICNEGGARSSKTWDTIHLITTFCDHNRDRPIPLKIGFFRYTLKDAREKLYEEDFKKCLKTIGIFDIKCASKENQSPEYKLFGNDIVFRGLDDASEQPTFDIVFINEALEIPSENFVFGLMMRCKKLAIFDWNPRYTVHWCFEMEGRPYTYFSKTTYRNNLKLDPAIAKSIERYSPWHLDDLHLPEKERRPHKENIESGTVKDWHFRVYGMGERASKMGVVFPNVKWHKEITTDCEEYFYGLDFGNTTGVYAFSYGCLNQDGLWFDDPIYGSFATKEDIASDSNSGLKNFWITLKSWLLSKGLKDKEIIIVSDSAQPQKITDLNVFAELDGFNCRFAPVKKFAGCIRWRIDIINRHKLNLVDRPHTRKEQENYTYREINGIPIDEPIDDFNHAWDAKGYSIQYQDAVKY